MTIWAIEILMGLAAAFAVIVLAPRLGPLLRVIDHADGERKLHRKPTPLLGGFAVALTLAQLAVIHAAVLQDLGPNTPFVLAAALGFFLVGFFDDRDHIPSNARLFLLGLIAAVAIFSRPELVLNQLYLGSLGFGLDLGLMAVPVTVLFVLLFQNAANMADGVDGVFLSLCLAWLILLMPWMGEGDLHIVVPLIACLALLLVANIMGRLFTGDSGTYALAVLIGLLGIKLYNEHAATLPADYVAACFLVPGVDMFRLFLQRIWQGRSPFSADRQHLHHHLLSLFHGHKLPSVAVYVALVLVAGLYPLADVHLAAIIGLQVAGYALIFILDARFGSDLRVEREIREQMSSEPELEPGTGAASSGNAYFARQGSSHLPPR